MKKWFAVLLLLLFCGVPGAIGEEAGESQEDWTVMFYFCGSDLESKYSYASQNLEEITRCYYPYKYYLNYDEENSNERKLEDYWNTDAVNVLIQTGGCKEWHAKRLGMDIATDKLQRWRYRFRKEESDEPYGYTLEQELPLQSMSDPQTLTDFIKWCAETCPAKKYALVLWDHGGGSKTGLFIDELFNEDVMSVGELSDALRDSGVHFESVLFDACMMANIETAFAIQDSASWMIASEEIVPGQGSDVDGWLQELINNPYHDGRRMGRFICNMTQKKYVALNDNMARAIMTWSVIDLSKIGQLVAIFDEFFQDINHTYAHVPSLMYVYAEMLYRAEEYGMSHFNMRDIASVLYNEVSMNVMDTSLRDSLLNALSDAVVYNVHGSGRSSANGLSFCYATGFSEEELEVYSSNCISPSYLAFLDAISEWEAPKDLYDLVERLPRLEDRNEFKAVLEKRINVNGVPGIYIDKDDENYISGINYRLYRYDPDTDQVLQLGKTPCRAISTEDGDYLFSAIAPWMWPSINGQLCDIEMVFNDDDVCIYNIPVKIGQQDWKMRCGRNYHRYLNVDGFAKDASNVSSTYTLYGFWEGYDDDTHMPGRNVSPLSQKSGQDFRLLYPVDSRDVSQATMYQASDPLTLYRAMEVKEIPLPAGTYYLEYEICDMFLRKMRLERIELHWDGQQLSIPDNLKWEGTFTLDTYKQR